MAGTDGAIIGLTKIVNAGTASGKWNLVVVAEGYTSRQLTHFDTHARDFAKALLATPPFTTLAAAINVYKLDVSSTDSGADDPKFCVGGTGAVARTFFDASFCNNGERRLLEVNTAAVLAAVDMALPEYDVAVVIVNSPIYGGSGYSQVAVCSLAANAYNIALHELGHAAFALDDEYFDGKKKHGPFEPAAANITIQKTKANLKWKDLLSSGTPIPTAKNPMCSQTIAATVTATPAGTGTFEGARHFGCRVYRPANNCKMRDVNHGFCAVCQAHITRELTPFLATS